jgi:mono/diheme cytochrome c family protein
MTLRRLLRSNRWLVACLTALVALTATGCGSSDPTGEIPTGEIVQAARAPYIAVVRRDAHALCAAFTPAAAADLASNLSPGMGCDHRVAEAFARSEPIEPAPLSSALMAVKVRGVVQHGNSATAVVTFMGPAGTGSKVRLALTRLGGSWRVATPPRIGLIKGCNVHGQLSAHCQKNARVMVFSIGTPELRSEPRNGVNGQPLVPVPPAVENAGGSELAEFDAGMKVVAQSGCLACHRIDDQGNSGPGPELTHIGSKLSVEQIEHAIVDPTAPMPSFNLPATKLKDVVEFLSQLQTRRP